MHSRDTSKTIGTVQWGQFLDGLLEACNASITLPVCCHLVLLLDAPG